MCDLISRQAAIDALTRKMVSIPTAGKKDLMGDVNRIRAEDISVIRRLPSAQPETHDKRTKTHSCDCISRQDAISAFWELNIELRPSCIDAIIDMLKGLPSLPSDMSGYSDRLWRNAYERGKAEPQRKKGHWIRHPEQRNIFNSKTIECSECHEKYTVQYVEDEWFCRHCGADMREDGEADVDAES